MQINDPYIFIEINKKEFIFSAGRDNENNTFQVIDHISIPCIGITNNQISDIDSIYNLISKNILKLEQKLNLVFKDVILVLDIFNYSLLNCSGFKKLNGSQLVKENITYIINSIKSKIDELEEQKKILHIFNSKFILDKNQIENLPIGLFGNFYSHELTFFLIDKKDYKNLQMLIERCNLRLKKIISKKYLEGISLINENCSKDTFFKINMNEKNCQIFFFENSTLRFCQDFEFGSDLIINDISKIIAFKSETTNKILLNSNFTRINNSDFIEKEYFENKNFRKIKKKLIFDIASARIQEISEVVIFKNINTINFLKDSIPIFLNINFEKNITSLNDAFKLYFSQGDKYKINFIDKISVDKLITNAGNLVQYGWNNEALPIIKEKKSLISRIFDKIFS